MCFVARNAVYCTIDVVKQQIVPFYVTKTTGFTSKKLPTLKTLKKIPILQKHVSTFVTKTEND